MVKIVKKTSNKNKFSPLFFPVVLLLITIILVLSYFYFFLPNNNFEKSNNTSNSLSMGSQINTDDMEVTVISAFRGKEVYEYPGPFVDYCRARKGKIIVLEIDVKNISDKPLTVDHFPIIDTNNRVFESTNNLYSCIESKYIMWFPRDINPGMETSFVSIYEVPEDNAGYSLKVTD